ncbi:hypothetical protein ZWY2020_033126 [Hordeum vulgare]|nr:hypothetical protein ZWY2020_033126 [Hordeum vulgare]
MPMNRRRRLPLVYSVHERRGGDNEGQPQPAVHFRQRGSSTRGGSRSGAVATTTDGGPGSTISQPSLHPFFSRSTQDDDFHLGLDDAGSVVTSDISWCVSCYVGFAVIRVRQHGDSGQCFLHAC